MPLRGSWKDCSTRTKPPMIECERNGSGRSLQPRERPIHSPTCTVREVADERTVRCSNCGALRPGAETVDGVERSACPNCGSVSITVHVGLSASVRAAALPPSLLATHPTDANTRLAKVRAAVDSISDPNRQAHLGDAVVYVMAALEGIHQLEDARRDRSEWSNTHWSPPDVELWTAHLAARNGAHHKDWTPIEWYADGSWSGERWAPNLPAVNSKAQRAAYAARLEGQPTVPSLHVISALVAGSIK
jgi:hypothetical protein